MNALITRPGEVPEKQGKYFSPTAVSSTYTYHRISHRAEQKRSSEKSPIVYFMSQVGEVAWTSVVGSESDIVITWQEPVEQHATGHWSVLAEWGEWETATLDKLALEKDPPFVLEINLIGSKRLRRPLSAIVEQDDGAYLAQLTDLPLYGHGESVSEAIEALKRELASLYEDLTEDDNFTEDWLRIKKFLRENIIKE